VIAQELELLPDLWADIIVSGVELAEVSFETIDFIEFEAVCIQSVNTTHHFDKPTSGRC